MSSLSADKHVAIMCVHEPYRGINIKGTNETAYNGASDKGLQYFLSHLQIGESHLCFGRESLRKEEPMKVCRIKNFMLES